MKTQGRRQSKNVIDKRNRRVEPSIVGIAKRNSEDVQWMKDYKSVPDKVKTDLGNALNRIRRNSAVKQTRDDSVRAIAREALKNRKKKGRV